MVAARIGPKKVAHHVLVRMRVTGGFLAGAELEFADGLNCFIGGRGAGKTTALELLRFGLGLMPDMRTQPQRLKALDALVKANLGSGKVAVDLRTKSEMVYTASRGAHETVQVVNEQGTALAITLDRDLIFSADVFSQNEIEEMASNIDAQLWLLDRFDEKQSAEISSDLDRLLRLLEQSSIDLRRLDQELDDLSSKASEIAGIEEKLKGLAEVGGPDAAAINAAHSAKALRVREEKIPDALLAAMQQAAREIGIVEKTLQSTIQSQVDENIARGPNADLFATIMDDARAFEHDASAMVAEFNRGVSAAAMRMAAHKKLLADLHAGQEASYREFVSVSEQQGGRAAERTALQTLHAAALVAKKEQEAKEKQKKDARIERMRLLSRLSELRDQRFELRKAIADGLSRQFERLRITVAQGADTETYKRLLVESLKNSGVRPGQTAERLTEVYLPSTLARATAEADLVGLVERTGFDHERSRKILAALRSTGVAYDLETVDMGDKPTIELLDGQVYKESSKLSTGQRCTTVLPILLMQSERPLLIDQPEDNLDNAFVYDTIVKALRDVKGARQVIFVTHNPNIPVLGEAERVFVFASDGQQAFLQRVGTVDECKDDIERILEGGRDAFIERHRRYGH